MVKKRMRAINVIAGWMVLSTLPGIYAYIRYGIDMSLIVVALIEWIYFACSVIAAIGLFLRKGWARAFAVKLLVIYFCWTLYVAYSLAAAFSFTALIEQQSAALLMPPNFFKNIVLVFLVTYILWPIIAVLTLTHPSVKQVFDPNYDPEKEKDEVPSTR